MGAQDIVPQCHTVLSPGTETQIDPEATGLHNSRIIQKQNQKLSTEMAGLFSGGGRVITPSCSSNVCCEDLVDSIILALENVF